MIRVKNVKISIYQDNFEYHQKKLSQLLKINSKDIKEIKIHKKSLDARNKNNIFYVYNFDIKVFNEEHILTKKISNVEKTPNEKYLPPIHGKEKLTDDIVICGAGPAGLLAAYLLCEEGYHPLIIERGKKIEERIEDVNNFWQNNILNEESNVQFGEGGAGTFSDGKLNTLVKDKRFIGKKVFEIFIACGAPKEIMYEQKPHIGTDILRKVIINLRNKIIHMGGKFLYNTKLTNLIIENEQLVQIEINNQEYLSCHNLILAIGHLARDTFRMLLNNGLKMEAKPFAMGIRIIHNQEMINESQYGKASNILPPASYKLTYTTKENRGVYSFCMCPGGYVVNASSNQGKLAINGMSNYKRDSKNANSAIVVTISPKDFGNKPLDGVIFQENLEKRAYDTLNGKIPIQLWQDYLNNQISTSLKNITPEIKGSYGFANINGIFPPFINQSLKEGITHFGAKIKGFDSEDTILAAIESRTSSPIRILRNENFESNIKGIYPCGEGAGYAGGITTSAIDGIKVAEAIIQKFQKN